jgi:hypothetical protein
VFGVLEQLEALGLELLEVRQIRAAPESPATRSQERSTDATLDRCGQPLAPASGSPD